MKKFFTTLVLSLAVIGSIFVAQAKASDRFIVETVFASGANMGVGFFPVVNGVSMGAYVTYFPMDDWTDNDDFSQDLRQAISTWANTNGYTGINSSNIVDRKVILSTVAQTGLFSDILSKPTTLAGYGITDTKKVAVYSGTTNASGIYTVTFGTAYSVAPNIQANIVGGSDTQNIRITSVSTTGFTVTVRNRTDVIGLLPSYSNVNGANVDVLITEK